MKYATPLLACLLAVNANSPKRVMADTAFATWSHADAEGALGELLDVPLDVTFTLTNSARWYPNTPRIGFGEFPTPTFSPNVSTAQILVGNFDLNNSASSRIRVTIAFGVALRDVRFHFLNLDYSRIIFDGTHSEELMSAGTEAEYDSDFRRLSDTAPASVTNPFRDGFGTILFNEGNAISSVSFYYEDNPHIGSGTDGPQSIDGTQFTLSGTTCISGDYNCDGTVDAADYTVWRDNLGSTVTLPGDTTPGSITPADYEVWRSSFGNSSAGLSSVSAAVPEPNALWLFGLGATLLALVRSGS